MPDYSVFLSVPKRGDEDRGSENGHSCEQRRWRRKMRKLFKEDISCACFDWTCFCLCAAEFPVSSKQAHNIKTVLHDNHTNTWWNTCEFHENYCIYIYELTCERERKKVNKLQKLLCLRHHHHQISDSNRVCSCDSTWKGPLRSNA